jgi:hypothetical protein
MALVVSEDYFDHSLVDWFARHGGPWSGTASELLAAMRASTAADADRWPQSFRALYSHIESHQQTLLSLGVDATLHHGPPRMISLRMCPRENAGRAHSPRPEVCGTEVSGTEVSGTEVSGIPDSATSLPVPTQGGEQPASRTDSEPPVDGEASAAHTGFTNLELGIFKNVEEGRFALVEMRVQIGEKGLHLKAAIDLVAARAHEITHACGIIVGLLKAEGVVYTSRAGVASKMGDLEFQANLFQFCLRTGRTVQLRDARSHPLVGAACRKAGIGALIIVPLFHHRTVAGAIEFLFDEHRYFSISDVMDLELIAGIISETFGSTEQPKGKPTEVRESLSSPETAENKLAAPNPVEALGGVVH